MLFSSRTGRLFQLGFAGLIAVLPAMVAYFAIDEKEWPMAVGSSLFTALILLSMYVGWVSWVKAPRDESAYGLEAIGDQQSVVVHYRREIHVVIVALMGLAGGMFVLVDLYLHHDGDPGSDLILYGAIALFFLSYVIEVAIGTIHLGYVALSPEGVRHVSWSSEAFIPWSAVSYSFISGIRRPQLAIVAEPVDAFTWRRTSLLWRVDKKPTTASMEIDLVYLGVEPDKLEAIINYFHQNPAARTTLNAHTGLEYVRQVSRSR